MPYMVPFAVAFLTTTASSAEVLLDMVVACMDTVIQIFGSIISALLATDGALAALFPFVAIGLCFGLFYGGIRLVKTFVPGF